MTIAEAFSGNAVTVSSAEFSLTNSSTVIAARTTAGHISLLLDPANMTAAEEYEVALQEKVRSGGTQRRVVIGNLKGVSSTFIWPGLILLWGWDLTLKKIAGTDRAFDWSVRAVT